MCVSVWYRWLLLDFKREFLFADSIRLFEVLNSHHLELNSDTAQKECDKVLAAEFELEGRSVCQFVRKLQTIHVCVCVCDLV